MKYKPMMSGYIIWEIGRPKLNKKSLYAYLEKVSTYSVSNFYKTVYIGFCTFLIIEKKILT